LEAEVTGLTAIVRMAEIVEGAAGVPVVVGAIVGAAGAADGLVAADVIVDGVGLAGEGTRNSLPRICTDKHGRPRCESWSFVFLREKQVPFGFAQGRLSPGLAPGSE
jgi:hypothetical protein